MSTIVDSRGVGGINWVKIWSTQLKNGPLAARPPSVVVTSCYLISSVWSFFPILGLFQFLAKFFMGLTIGELFVVNLESGIVFFQNKVLSLLFKKLCINVYNTNENSRFFKSKWNIQNKMSTLAEVGFYYLEIFLRKEKWLLVIFVWGQNNNTHFQQFCSALFWSFYKSHKVFLSAGEGKNNGGHKCGALGCGGPTAYP